MKGTHTAEPVDPSSIRNDVFLEHHRIAGKQCDGENDTCGDGAGVSPGWS